MFRSYVLLLVATLASVAVAGHDVGISEILEPDTLVVARGSVRPAVKVRNYGTFTESYIPVRCFIDSAGERVYASYKILDGPLPPGAESLVWWFPPFRPGGEYCWYDVTFFTALSTDENRSNDTMKQRTWWSPAYITDTLHPEQHSLDPVFDGVIDPDEWRCHRFDISDVNGRGGTTRPRGTCILYLAHTDHVWLAVDVRALNTRQDDDRILVYLDENRDCAWATDSSEGTHCFFVSGGRDSLVYSWMPGRQRLPCPGCTLASSVAGGNLQFEARIPVGQRKGDISIPWERSSGGAVSFWRGDSCYGWWPQSLELSHWDDPEYYGLVVWVSNTVEEESEQPGAIGSRLTAQTMTRGMLRLADGVPAVLLDITGRKVANLMPGENDIRHLAPGVYFIRQKEDRIINKVVIQK
ncbi:hypothetical protein CH330_04240 [candidate division WOR-3 bacterium JGI_Cruoil_03_51_56]|uniref:CARDB domain-containing protein n=1 Tax=candidate division WOR-3 bacterium JGI_Cruoil_03_51_56 TaxID=1973747 RepID=A0A235BUQ5_UNCW3|nr:MAG: hypothetical protein CH330_04240 [candidate division WOR-3 bacterium JGI_Cruoil_03_51_56]